MSREYKVLVNYELNGIEVAQSLYTGPHKKHADNAYMKACVLGQHGILVHCTVTFWDGYRLRADYTRNFHPKGGRLNGQ